MIKRLLLAAPLYWLAIACSSPAVIEDGFVLSLNDSIYYKTIGEGEPLLIIHGGPVLDHQYLLEHFETLSRTYKLIFYDQRACGRSGQEIDPDHMTFAAMLNDIESIRAHLGYDSVSVLGHSWGGLLAMKYAIAHDARVDKLILSNSMAPSAEDWNRENLALSERYTAGDREQLDKLSSSGLLRSKEAAPYITQMMMLSYKTQFFDTEKMENLNLFITNDYHLRSAVFMRIAEEMEGYDHYDDLSNMSSPSLIIFGANEPAVDLYLTKFTNSMPYAESLVIDKSGHFPFIEQPHQYFQAVKDFLK